MTDIELKIKSLELARQHPDINALAEAKSYFKWFKTPVNQPSHNFIPGYGDQVGRWVENPFIKPPDNYKEADFDS